MTFAGNFDLLDSLSILNELWFVIYKSARFDGELEKGFKDYIY